MIISSFRIPLTALTTSPTPSICKSCEVGSKGKGTEAEVKCTVISGIHGPTGRTAVHHEAFQPSIRNEMALRMIMIHMHAMALSGHRSSQWAS